MTLNLNGLDSEDTGGSALVVSTGMDLDVIRPKFEDYKDEAALIVANAKAIEVKDDDSLNAAVVIGGSAKKVAKAIDVQRKAIILEPSDFVKGVNSLCKAITDNLDEAERITKQKIGQHQARVELERRKQEELARKAADELQKKINAEAKKSGVEAPQVVAPVIPVAQKVVRTENGASYQVKRWICTVINPAEVPREYCEPSKRLLDDAVKMGVRKLPGCKIEEISETRFRT